MCVCVQCPCLGQQGHFLSSLAPTRLYNCPPLRLHSHPHLHSLPSWRASNEYEPAPRHTPNCGITWSLRLSDGILGCPRTLPPCSDSCYLCPGLALILGRIYHHKLACHGKQLKEKNKPPCNLRVLGNEELQGGGMKKLYKNLFLHHNNVLLYG